MKTGTYGIIIKEPIFDHSYVSYESTAVLDLIRPKRSQLRDFLAMIIFRSWVQHRGGLAAGAYVLRWQFKRLKLHAKLKQVI